MTPHRRTRPRAGFAREAELPLVGRRPLFFLKPVSLSRPHPRRCVIRWHPCQLWLLPSPPLNISAMVPTGPAEMDPSPAAINTVGS